MLSFRFIIINAQITIYLCEGGKLKAKQYFYLVFPLRHFICRIHSPSPLPPPPGSGLLPFANAFATPDKYNLINNNTTTMPKKKEELNNSP